MAIRPLRVEELAELLAYDLDAAEGLTRFRHECKVCCNNSSAQANPIFRRGKLARVVEFGLEAVKAREWCGIMNFKLRKGKAVARKSRSLVLHNRKILRFWVVKTLVIRRVEE